MTKQLSKCYKETKKNEYIQVKDKLFHLPGHVVARRALLSTHMMFHDNYFHQLLTDPLQAEH